MPDPSAAANGASLVAEPAATRSTRTTTTFRTAVHLTKREAFDACQALADADRVLVAVGAMTEAAVLADLFGLLEDRLTRP